MCHQLIYYKSFWYNYEAFILILIKRIYDIFTMIWIWPVANLSQSFIELNLRRYTILARESRAHAIVNTQVKVFQLNICFRENGPHLHQNLWNQNSHQEGKNSRTIWIPLKIPGENSGKSSKNPHHQSFLIFTLTFESYTIIYQKALQISYALEEWRRRWPHHSLICHNFPSFSLSGLFKSLYAHGGSGLLDGDAGGIRSMWK